MTTSSIFAACAALTAMTLAVSPARADELLSGPYIGLEAGYTRTSSEASVTSSTGRVGSDIDGAAAGIGVFGGYGHQFANGVYLGSEAHLGFGGGDARRQIAGLAAEIEGKRHYGAALRAGYVFGENTLVYAKIGAEASRFALRRADGRSADVTLTGRQLGLGLERAFGEHSSARLEIERVDYADKAFSAAAQRLTYDPAALRVQAGLAYRF